MKRCFWMGAVALAVVGILAFFVYWHDGAAPPATAQAPVVSVDMDPGTAGIQSTRSVVHPGTFCAAVVIADSPSDIGGLDIELAYDQGVIDAPEVANSGAALNDNPNLNNSSGSPGNPLGTGGCPNETGFLNASTSGAWDCSGAGYSYPVGDTDGDHGDGDGTAKIGCFRTGADNGTGDGILAYVTFNTVAGGGPVSLTLQNVSVADPYAGEIGSCNPVLTVEMACNDGSITVTGAPTATPTRTRTPTLTPTPITPTSTPSCGGEGQPTCTPTPQMKRRPTTTPTPTDTPVPETATPVPPTQPPPPPPPPVATDTPFGGPGGIIVPPPTGTGSDGGSQLLLIILSSLAGVGALTAAGGGLYLRRARSRREGS